MKKTALFLALILTVGLVGCGGTTEDPAAENNSAGTGEVAAEPFEGEYIVDADYVKENLDDIILVDARGDEAAAEGND